MEVTLLESLTRPIVSFGLRPRAPRPWSPGVALGMLLALAFLPAAFPPLGARAMEILPVDQIEPGMKGIGRSVFQGIDIEEFGVEIIGVIERARPAGNLILFRGEGDVLEHAGIIQGMSGSPVYIDGKLIGAVAFAYPGAKDPVGAITPIGEMLALWDGDLGPAERGTFPSLGDPVGTPSAADGSDTGVRSGSPAEGDPATTAGQYFDFEGAWGSFLHSNSATGVFSSLGSGEVPGAMGGAATGGLSKRDPGADQEPLLPLKASVDTGLGSTTGGLVPIGTPLCFSGWDPSLDGEITRVFARLGMPAVPVTGSVSGVSSRYAGVTRLEPGSAIGLRMIGGDADLVAIGTVTHVEGDRVVAFGHPMIQAGEVSFPMTGAWIHTVLANRNVSTKMGSSTNALGGIWNDRRPGIAGLHGTIPDQLPVRVEVRDEDGGDQNFHYTVARHPLLTPFFLPWTVTNSYLASGWVTGDASIRTDVTVYYEGGRTVRRVERIGAEAPGTALGADITLPAVLLAINPWESVRIDSLAVRVDYERGNPQATVVDVRSSHRRAHPGDVVTLLAELRPFRGEPEFQRFEVEIPAAWAGKSLRCLVGANAEFSSWDQDRVPEKFVPHSLDQMISMMERMPDDSKLTLRVYDGESGVLLQGVELSGLPPSLAGATSQSSRPGGIQAIQAGLLEERHLDTRWVLSGGSVVSIEVASS